MAWKCQSCFWYLLCPRLKSKVFSCLAVSPRIFLERNDVFPCALILNTLLGATFVRCIFFTRPAPSPPANGMRVVPGRRPSVQPTRRWHGRLFHVGFPSRFQQRPPRGVPSHLPPGVVLRKSVQCPVFLQPTCISSSQGSFGTALLVLRAFQARHFVPRGSAGNNLPKKISALVLFEFWGVFPPKIC